MKITGEVQEYIMSLFKHALTKDYYPYDVSKSYSEGKGKTVTVNVS